MRPLIPYWLNANTFIHALLTSVIAAMAVQLFLPTSTYASGNPDGRPAGNWRVIATYMDERTLAAVLWSIACIGLVGLLCPGRPIRLASVLVLSVTHGILAAGFMSSNPSGVGALLLTGYAIAGAYLTFRRTSEGA